MNDTEQELVTVIRALEYVGTVYKNKLVKDERDAIQTVQSALARISMNERHRPDVDPE